ATARQLLRASGYHDVTMVAIAEKVGITPGALYRHFASKAMLLEEVVASSVDEVAPVFDDRMSIRQALAANCAIAVRIRDTGVLWSREARYLPEAGYERLRERLRAHNCFYRTLIRADRPELRDSDPELLAWGVQSVLASPGYHSVQLSAAEFASTLERACTGLCATAIVPPRSSATPPGHVLIPVSQRERLLVAATRLFGENGFQATSMGDIGAEAGVTGPSLYSYFASKLDLLNAAMDRGTHALWLGLHSALRESDSPREALEAVARSYVAVSREHATLVSALITEPALLTAAARAREKEYVAEWVALLCAARPGLAEGPARILVHAALTVINDLARTPHLIGDSFWENLAAMAIAVLLTDGEVSPTPAA
ncbi:MAG: TetR/AcrR family transcriptional regulator, partial [Sciscionella sp.]